VLYNPDIYPENYSLLNLFYKTELDVEIPTLSIQYIYVVSLVAYETLAWYAGIFIAIYTLREPEIATPPFFQTVSSLIVSSFG
jgi:hypothetical protein